MKIQTIDPLLKHKFIILCGDHYNPLGLIRSLGENGIYPIVILISPRHYLVECSKYIGQLHFTDNIKEGLDLLLKKYGNENEKPFLFTCSDDVQSAYDNHYDILKDNFHFFQGGETGRITHLMNKDEINKLASSVGFKVPNSQVVNKGEIPTTVNYPVITKSIMSIVGGWKNDVYICKNEAELLAAYKNIEAPVVLVEEYIEKKNELPISGVSINGGQKIYCPFKIEFKRFTDSAYGNYMTVSPFEDKELLSKIQTLLQKANYSGIFEIEFLIDQSDNLIFLEVNFRNTAWNYAFAYGGANLQLIWARSTLKGELDLTDVKLRQEPFTAMAEMADFNDHVRHGDLSLRQWLKDFHDCPCTYVYDPKNRKPFFALVWHSLKLLFKKNLSK